MLAICSDGRNSTQGFLEMGIDGAAGDAVQPFQLAGCPEVVFLVDDVDESQGKDEDKENWCGSGDDAEGEQSATCVDKELRMLAM